MNKKKALTPVYFVPGMAASPKIFEYINLPEEEFKTFYISWKSPEKNESLKAYSSRMADEILEPDPVLIGVSFGGVIVQEISRMIKTRQVIIISSFKTRNELPLRLKFLGNTGLDRFLPTSLARFAKNLVKWPIGGWLKKRAKVYKRYMSETEKSYLDWSIHHTVTWPREKPMENIIHIHGDADVVLPIKNIGDCIVVPGGTHVMILDRFRWFNENLPVLIRKGELKKE